MWRNKKPSLATAMSRDGVWKQIKFLVEKKKCRQVFVSTSAYRYEKNNYLARANDTLLFFFSFSFPSFFFFFFHLFLYLFMLSFMLMALITEVALGKEKAVRSKYLFYIIMHVTLRTLKIRWSLNEITRKYIVFGSLETYYPLMGSGGKEGVRVNTLYRIICIESCDKSITQGGWRLHKR